MALNPPLPGEERTVSVAAFSMHRAGMRPEEEEISSARVDLDAWG